MTLKVVAGIHWEALKLLLKGVRMLPYHPAAKRVATQRADGCGTDRGRREFGPRSRDQLASMTTLAAALSPVAILNAISGSGRVAETRDVAYGTGQRNRLDIYAPTTGGDEYPVIVFFYGGGWEEGDRAMYRFVGTALASRGFVVAIPDYRVYPEVRFPGFVEDGARAMRWVRDNIAGLWRRSVAHRRRRSLRGRAHRGDARDRSAAGFAPRAWTIRVDLCGLVGLAGPYDFLPLHSETLKIIFGPEEERPTLSQPINFVEPGLPPSLLIAGSGDRVVDPGNTTRLAKRLREVGQQRRCTSLSAHRPRPGDRGVCLAVPWLRTGAARGHGVRGSGDGHRAGRRGGARMIIDLAAHRHRGLPRGRDGSRVGGDHPHRRIGLGRHVLVASRSASRRVPRRSCRSVPVSRRRGRTWSRRSSRSGRCGSGSHILRRTLKGGDDPRYAQLKEEWGDR